MKLLTIIFILLAFSSVPAQKQGEEEIVLAAGGGNLTQSKIERVIGFFEWSLETKLSDDERAELQREIIENWKKRDCREIEGVSHILRLADAAKNFDAEESEQMRALYKKRFTKEFERGNKISSLILSGVHVQRSESGEIAIDSEQ